MRLLRRRLLPVAVVLVPLAGATCTPSPDQGNVQILTVDDPFVGPPVATEITVQSVAYDDGGADGEVSTLAESPYDVEAGGSIDLGTYDETDTESLLVTATDAHGASVAWGETLPLELAAVAGETIGVFVQRTGTLSRMPSPLSEERPAPLLNIVGGRYVFVSGGTDSTVAAQTRLYDLIAWAPLASPPTLSFAPASTVIAQPTEGDFQALAISATGAQWYDLTDSDTDDASAPTGAGSWAEVAGGATIVCPNQGYSFVVGATRASGATSTVLIVSATGGLAWASLSTARAGASAACLDSLGGIVVEGGNTTSASSLSSQNAGAESLSATGTLGSPLAYLPDTTTGAGMVALDGSHVLVVGGGTSARVLTVPCSASDGGTCEPTPWQATLPTLLVFTQVFALDATDVFVVGEDATGAMHAYTMSESTAVEIPFRVPRSHARAIRLPLNGPGGGPIAVVGGDADGGANTAYIESFVP